MRCRQNAFASAKRSEFFCLVLPYGSPLTHSTEWINLCRLDDFEEAMEKLKSTDELEVKQENRQQP